MSSRQPTPGPSLQPLNQKRGAVTDTETLDDTRDAKKLKVAIESTTTKDKKKKRKRKQRKPSVVVMSPNRARSLSRSVAPMSSCTAPTQPANAQVTAVVSDSMVLDDDPALDDPAPSSSDKGKGKAKSPTPALQPSTSADVDEEQLSAVVSSTTSHSDAQEIARLKEQLAAQRQLLDRHQTHIIQVQQSLTCQICLDLLHKPYALAPCGHISCYACLVRWFTSVPDRDNQNQNPDPVPVAAPPDAAPENPEQEAARIINGLRRGQHMHKRKTCPLCRAVVTARPVEVYGVKGMVGTLVRSALIELPVPVPVAGPSAENANEPNAANADPWNNVFPPARRTHGIMGPDAFFPGILGMGLPPAPQDQEGDREQMGWYDQEDGGIYRCLECMHEIWAGVCSQCGRLYPGHGDAHDDDEEDDDDDDENGDGGIRRRRRRRAIQHLLLRAARHGGGDDDVRDAFEEEALLAADAEYLDRIEGFQGFRNAFLGDGELHLPPLDLPEENGDIALQHLALDDLEEEEDDDENGWMTHDGGEGPAVGAARGAHRYGALFRHMALPAAARRAEGGAGRGRGAAGGALRIYDDSTDDEAAAHQGASSEVEVVDDESDDDSFIDDSTEFIDLDDEEDEDEDGDGGVMATLAMLRQSRDAGGRARAGGGSRAAAGGSRAGAGGSRTNGRAQRVVVVSEDEETAPPILVSEDEDEEGTPVRVPRPRRRALRLEESEDEDEEEEEASLSDAFAAALDQLDFEGDPDTDEVQRRRGRAADAAERRRVSE